MLLGLRDTDTIACVTHGFKRDSPAAVSQLNPVDAVFRMAADMSGCFTSSRPLESVSLPDATAQLLSTPLPSASYPVSVAYTAMQP